MEAYLDNSATTRAYPEVGDLVYKVMCQDYGNPSSMHRKGVDAEHYVKEAKETIAKVLKVNAKDIYFTSGGTESDNLALIGCARANRRAGNHLITTSIEHPAILNTMRYLEEEEGFRVTYLPVDASGRVNLEALKEAQDANAANIAKTTFLNHMSHDIRTPMNAIVGLTAIAGANIESQDRVIECLSKITESSRHLLGLINEVLDMARIESGKMTLAQEDFNLSELVDNLITLTKPVLDEHKHNFDIHINHIEHEAVCGDSLRIQQVFVNLMSNAIKYTPDGGNIIFSIEEKPNGFSELGCYEFTIEDNGIGMSPEFQKIMFDPFSRADDHRTTRV